MVGNNIGARSVQELFSLNGKVCVVTGGAGEGFGAQITQALAEAGAQVVMTSRGIEKARSKAALYKQDGFLVEAAELELTNENSISSLVPFVVERYGRIDILFNNAALNHLETIERISLDDWNRVLSANVTGTMLMSRAVAPHMIAQGGGAIVNVSSIYGVVSPDQRIYGDSGINSPLVYAVTKAAIIQMTRYLATYWAPTIRVNCITPGGLFNNQDEDFVENYNARTPLGRMAGQDDLKGAALYLASDASKWVTGHNLIVDGGLTVW